MSAQVTPRFLRYGVRSVALGLAAAGLAGCSADSVRLSEGPFNSPYARTASVEQQRPHGQGVPVARVESQPLPPPQSAALPPVSSTGAATGVSYGYPQGGDVTGSVNAPPRSGAHQWSWNGGTPVTIEAGDTLDSMARRYGVPASAIMQANNLTSPSQVIPGQRLVIPRYAQTAAAPPPAAPPRAAAPRVAPQATPVGSTHIVQSGETLSSLGRRYGKTRAEIARANNLPADTKIRIGQPVIIPGARIAQAASAVSPKSAAQPASASSPVGSASAARPAPTKPNGSSAPVQKVAASEPPASARLANAEPAADPEPAPDTTGGTPSFRWPARGRIIAGFGPKPNGQQNDGINLAVPEGTTIKAADDGVVAYAGNELKGYGNLVLVRHSGGYVTAYAHASELLVKRGDPVKRGQAIGRAGQTGNVNSPQLHFEIRKGKDPVDPMQYLAGG